MALLSLFILRSIEERGLIDNAARLGPIMLDRLRDSLCEYDQVGDIRGLGLMQGIEFVLDRRTQRYATELRDRIIRNCIFKQRLWILGAGRSSIRLLPPLVISEDEAMEAVSRLERAVAEEIAATKALQEATAAEAV